MLIQIFQKTPVWVWGLLAGLIALSYSQTRSRQRNVKTLLLMPIAMLVFSLVGTLLAFGISVMSLLPWLLTYAVTAAVIRIRSLPVGSYYDRKTKLFNVPGSWVPMVIILAIFVTKYAVGVSLAMQPDLKSNPTFIGGISMLYGLFSGIFAGRVLRLIRHINT